MTGGATETGASDGSRVCQDRPVHVIVVGCGRVGSELAITLDQGGHSVAIMDKNQAAFRKLPDGWGGRAVHGFGFDRDHLEAAGVRSPTPPAPLPPPPP